MRVVLDTNVVISAVFFGGTRVGDDLGRRHPELRAAFEPVLTLIAMNALIVDALALPDPVSADPDDDIFLATAFAAQASVIVSGDRDLLDVSGWRDIVVSSPRQFVDQHLRA